MATTAIGVAAARELDELYRLHAAEVFRYAYAVLGNSADAEDITQATFVNALRALERGERPRKPTNWLITIAHNLIRQRFRRQQTRPLEVELDRDVAAAEAADDGPSIDDLVRALQRIPPTQRQALVLRELEGRSYSEIGELLGVSQSALEALLFRARRSLAEELENVVTCDRAELALSRETDGRLGRKERRRLLAHIDECASCARVAATSIKYRRAFKALAVLPLPFSLTLFKGAPTASAAAGLTTIGAGAAAGGAAGVAATGVSAKIAIGLAAVAVAGGAGYEGVKAASEPAPPLEPAAKVLRAAVPEPATAAAVVAVTPSVVTATPVVAKKPKPVRAKPVRTPAPDRGRSAAAPGQTKEKTKPAPERKALPGAKPRAAAKPKPTPKQKPEPAPKAKSAPKVKPVPKEKTVRAPKPKTAVEPVQGKSAAAPGRLKDTGPAKPKPEPKG